MLVGLLEAKYRIQNNGKDFCAKWKEEIEKEQQRDRKAGRRHKPMAHENKSCKQVNIQITSRLKQKFSLWKVSRRKDKS